MLYEVTVPQCQKMLGNMLAIFDKAAAHADVKKFETTVYLHARLAPDQFAFTRQIQIMCDTAKKGASYLSGKDAPVHADDETTFEQLRARIKDTIKYLETISEKDFTGAAERLVSQPRWKGQYLTGREFVAQHMLPNFYFHMTTAYEILRHNGVDIGKQDYLGTIPYKK